MLIEHKKKSLIDDSTWSDAHVKSGDWNYPHQFSIGSIIPVGVANIFIDATVIDAEITGGLAAPAHVSTGVISLLMTGLSPQAVPAGAGVSYICTTSTPRWPAIYAGWEAYASVTGDTVTVSTVDSDGVVADVDNASVSVTVYAVVTALVAPPV